MRETGKPQLYK